VREYRPGDVVELDGCRLSLHPLRHAAPNCGIRIETPAATLAYTGDTGLCDGLAPLARGADLLLAEATLDATDTGAHGHLSAADAGTVAARHGVGELVLTHFISADPAHLASRRTAAAAVFDGPVSVAQPGMRIPVAG
jgi:ribonuclease BN (tRNA processing enzyme)